MGKNKSQALDFWMDFLTARQKAIRWLLNRGATPEQVAGILSLDAAQVMLEAELSPEEVIAAAIAGDEVTS